MNKEPKPQTLTLNKEFKRAYYQGKSRATPYFVCYMVKNRLDCVRYGITTSKKLGNAVKRNHARRLLRAAFWSVLDQVPDGRDYVFVAREKILDAKSYQVASALKKCLRQLQKDQQKAKPAGEPAKNSPTSPHRTAPLPKQRDKPFTVRRPV